jgi:hypothetical protein
MVGGCSGRLGARRHAVAPARNPDVSGADLTRVTAGSAVAKAERVLTTIESLEANQRADLALAALFSDLAAPA